MSTLPHALLGGRESYSSGTVDLGELPPGTSRRTADRSTTAQDVTYASQVLRCDRCVIRYPLTEAKSSATVVPALCSDGCLPPFCSNSTLATRDGLARLCVIVGISSGADSSQVTGLPGCLRLKPARFLNTLHFERFRDHISCAPELSRSAGTASARCLMRSSLRSIFLYNRFISIKSILYRATRVCT